MAKVYLNECCIFFVNFLRIQDKLQITRAVFVLTKWSGMEPTNVSLPKHPQVPLWFTYLCVISSFFSPLWWAFFPTNELVKYSYTSTHHISYILSHMRIDTSICFMQVYRGRQKSDQNKKVIQFEPVIIALDYTTNSCGMVEYRQWKPHFQLASRPGKQSPNQVCRHLLLGSSKRCWDSGWHFCFQW